jgi:hypothetical protein
MSNQPYPVGTPGQVWGKEERALWLAKQVRLRSYADDVLRKIDALRASWQVETYGQTQYGDEAFELLALRSRDWRSNLPSVLVTGGVHGYETSGVHGALLFASQFAARFAGSVNFLIAPCVSPWAYERIQRWNGTAIDPNRSFREDGRAEESLALIKLVAPLNNQLVLHIDLHETTDTDESEFRPALAARDGKTFEPELIPDGFYLVGDTENPALEFQQYVINAVAAVTHIATADDKGEIIGSKVVAPGVILYPFRELGLCAGVSNARLTTTTEVYPDSPKATAAQCELAQATAVCAAIEFALR